MSVEHNPARYSEMSKPRPDEDSQASINEFFADVRTAREKHKIADVHVIVRVIIERDGEEFPGMSFAHFGSVQESEGMCAWAFAQSAEARRAFVDYCKVVGAKHTQKF